jgi:hypothetical protein
MDDSPAMNASATPLKRIVLGVTGGIAVDIAWILGSG